VPPSPDVFEAAAPECSPPQAKRRGFIARRLARRAEKKADAIADRVAAAHELTEAQTAELRAKLRTLADTKVEEYWLRRTTATFSSGVLAAGVAAAVIIGAGLMAPIALAPMGIGLACGIGASLYVLYKKLGNALEGAAQSYLRKEGLAGDDFLDRLAQRKADRIADRFIERFELTPEQADSLRETIRATAATKAVEFWKERSKSELGAVAGSALLTAGIVVGVGLVGPIGLASTAVGAAAGLAVTAGLLYLKLGFAVEASAYAAVMELTKGQPKDRRPKRSFLRRLASRRTATAVDKAAKKHGLSDEEKRRVAEAVEAVEDLKLEELWHQRPLATVAAPFARGGATAGIGAAAGITAPAVVGAAGVAAAAAAVKSAVMLYIKLGHAVQAAAEVSAKAVLADRPAAPLSCAAPPRALPIEPPLPGNFVATRLAQQAPG